MKTNILHRYISLGRGGLIRLTDVEKLEITPSSFQSTTVHKLALHGGGWLFVQGDKINNTQAYPVFSLRVWLRKRFKRVK